MLITLGPVSVVIPQASNHENQSITTILSQAISCHDSIALAIDLQNLIGVKIGNELFNLNHIPKTADVINVIQESTTSFSTNKISTNFAQTCDILLKDMDDLMQQLLDLKDNVKIIPVPSSLNKAEVNTSTFSITSSTNSNPHTNTILIDNEQNLSENVFKCCVSGDLQFLRKLIAKYGAEIVVNLKNATSFTPLHQACYHNQIHICTELIENGADIFATAKMEMTPLHIASTAGHINIVQLLMDQGADAFLEDKMGQSAIDKARRGNHIAIVDLLSKIYGISDK